MASAVVGALRVMLEVNAAHFSSEFQKAEVKIGQFDRLVSNTSRTMTRMVESFSGHKVVAEATKMSAAIEQIGGVSKLTERELASVTRTVNEAISKLKLMGAEAPEGLKNLHGELGKLTTVATTTTGSIGGLGTAFRALGPLLPVTSIAGVATSLIALGKSTIQNADAVGDMATKFRISTEAVQQFSFIADQTGTSVEVLAKASRTLAKNIAEGDDSTVGAVKALGLSMSDLAAKSPEQQFYEVGRALKNVADEGTQTSLAMELLGGRGAEALGAINAGMDEIAAKAPVMDAAIVKALGDIQDNFDGFIAKQKTSFGNWLGLWAVLIQEGPEKTLEAYKRLTFETAPPIADLTAKLQQQHSAVTDLTMSQKEMDRIAKELTETAKKKAAALEKAAEAAKKFRDSVSSVAMLSWAPFAKSVQDTSTQIQSALVAVANLNAGLEENGNLMSGTIQDMGRAQAEAAKWAHTMGAVLAPAMHGFKGALNETNQAVAKTPGLFASAFSGVADSIVRAIQGGGNILQAAGSQLGVNLGDMFVKNFGKHITGFLGQTLGGAINSLIPGLGALLGPLLSKIGGFFKNLFGIDPAVKAARSALEEFQSTLRAGLTDQQKQEAGNRDWAKDLIRVRDAYLAIGKTAEEAEKDVAAMWDTDNPEKSQAAIEKIQQALEEAERKLREGQEAAEDLADAVEDIPTDVTVRVRTEFDNSDIPPWVDNPDRPRESGGFGGGETSPLTAPLTVPDLGQTSAFSAGSASALAADPGVATPAPASATPTSTGTSVHVMPFMVGETWQQVKVGFQRYLETTGLSSGRAREIIDSIASDAARRVAVRG